MIKLYKRTIVVSILLSLIIMIYSVLAEFILKPILPSFFQFTENISIGIACSLLVVVITTYFQFKDEQNKLIDKCISDITLLIFDFLIIDIELKDDSIDYKNSHDRFMNHLSVAKRSCESILWFSPFKKRIMSNILKHISSIASNYLTNINKNYRDQLLTMHLEKSNEFVSICNETVKLTTCEYKISQLKEFREDILALK